MILVLRLSALVRSAETAGLPVFFLVVAGLAMRQAAAAADSDTPTRLVGFRQQ